MCRQMETTDATPRLCRLCGQLEHGSSTCSFVDLVNKGMDDIEAGRYHPVLKAKPVGYGPHDRGGYSVRGE